MLRCAQHDRAIFSQLLSPGWDGPHPAFGTPLPRGGRGDGGEGRLSPTHGLRRGLQACARRLTGWPRPAKR